MSYMFYGDRRRSENPRDFLYHFEEHLASLPNTSESRKCEHFYLHCRSGFNAEEWYENFEQNSPSIITSWSTLRKHFCVKWLGASTDILLEIPKEKPVTSTQLCTATNTSREMNTTTTTATSKIGQDNAEPREDREEKRERRAEERDKAREREAEREELDTEEEERIEESRDETR